MLERATHGRHGRPRSQEPGRGYARKQRYSSRRFLGTVRTNEAALINSAAIKSTDNDKAVGARGRVRILKVIKGQTMRSAACTIASSGAATVMSGSTGFRPGVAIGGATIAAISQ